MRTPEPYWPANEQGADYVVHGGYVGFGHALDRIISRLHRDGRLNTFRDEWDDEIFTHPMSTYRLRFVMFKIVIRETSFHITALDLWHPLENESVPDWCQPRSQLLAVHEQGLEVIAGYCSRLKHLALCSCVMMFQEEQLKPIFQLNVIGTLYLRGTMPTLSFLDFLPSRVRLLHLEMPSVNHPLLFTKISRFVAIDNFVLRYGVEADYTPYYPMTAYIEKCSSVSISEEVDVKGACKI